LVAGWLDCLVDYRSAMSVTVSGDDAVGVQWMDIGRHLRLYASHNSFVRAVVERLKAHW